MVSFKNYIEENEYKQTMIQFAFLIENADSLNENIEPLDEAVKQVLSKAGIHIKKGTGVLQYLAKFTSIAGKLVIAAVKKDKKRVKELSKSISKEELLDFILKLDMLTMHMITGPIHIIDAVTGWHIGAEVKSKDDKAISLVDKISKIYYDLKSNVTKAFKNNPEIIKNVNDLEPLIVLK